MNNAPSVICVALQGEFDLVQRQALHAFLAIEPEPSAVMVDLSGVTYMDSSALGALVALRERMLAAGGGSVALVTPGPHIERVFEITGLNAVFDRYDSFEDACRALAVDAGSVERRRFAPASPA